MLYILIDPDINVALQELTPPSIPYDDDSSPTVLSLGTTTTTTTTTTTDLTKWICRALRGSCVSAVQDDANNDNDDNNNNKNNNNDAERDTKNMGEYDDDWHREFLLIRPLGDTLGLYAHFLDRRGCRRDALLPNVRATRLEMACGHYAIRFYGRILLSRCSSSGFASYSPSSSLSCLDVQAACTISPDLRLCILQQLSSSSQEEEKDEEPHDSVFTIPCWLGDAAKNQYLDGDVLDRLAKVMTDNRYYSDNDDDDDDCDDDDDEKEDDEDHNNDDTNDEKKQKGRRTQRQQPRRARP